MLCPCPVSVSVSPDVCVSISVTPCYIRYLQVKNNQFINDYWYITFSRSICCYGLLYISWIKGPLNLSSVKVDRHPQFICSRCLFVVRIDGGWIDFSYQKCLRAYVRFRYPLHADKFIRKHFKRWSCLWLFKVQILILNSNHDGALLHGSERLRNKDLQKPMNLAINIARVTHIPRCAPSCQCSRY